MSLLTGEPRTATVLAVGDVVVVEIGADLFRRMAAVPPGRDREDRDGRHGRARAGLEQMKSAAAGAVAVETTTLMTADEEVPATSA